jgi:hypothetical protein
MELIGDNVYTSALVKYGQNMPCRSLVVAKTSSTNQMPDQLINMHAQNLSIIELIQDNVTTRPYVKFRQNRSRIEGVIAFTMLP